MAKQKCDEIKAGAICGEHFGILKASISDKENDIEINYVGPIFDTHAEAVKDVNRLAKFLNLQGRAR